MGSSSKHAASSYSADRAGRFVTQPTGYRAFIPEPLPPQPPVAMDAELMALLTQAERAIARLDGVVRVIPDPDFFVAMYVRREAVLSSQIEGTQSSLQDLLEAELDPARGLASDVGDIVNYVAAMNHGLERLEELPLSLRLIREIHAELLRGGRGGRATPGEFRTTQKWIGPAGAPLARATFVPPPPYEMSVALGNLETYLHRDERAPLLMEIGLTHAQFETVHPFLDGNGRVGRLLITFLLVHRGALRRPVRYLSHFFKLNRAEYYDRLMAIRLRGDWEGWMRFFLRGVAETADEATVTAERILEMREQHRSLVMEHTGRTGLLALSALFQRPVINVKRLATDVSVTFPTANRLVSTFVELGLLKEVTGQRRSRLFMYAPYLRLFDDASDVRVGDDGRSEETVA